MATLLKAYNTRTTHKSPTIRSTRKRKLAIQFRRSNRNSRSAELAPLNRRLPTRLRMSKGSGLVVRNDGIHVG